VAAAIDAYLETRGELTPDTLLFATATGRPTDRWYVAKLIRRIARLAGIPSADRLSPHSLRHSGCLLPKDFSQHAFRILDPLGIE
jgi:integrase/recombinase XerD